MDGTRVTDLMEAEAVGDGGLDEPSRAKLRATKPAPASTADDATPMMKQYIEIRAANPDSLLFYRMGDFYELFFDDAVEAARALGIHLTKRGKHLGEDIPMCGVPVATADDYLQKLITLGYRVAVCEQLENPAEAKKRGSKSVVRRDVVRLVTPGTITEDKLLDPSRPRPLAALARVRSSGDNRFAIASIELSTGVFQVVEVSHGEIEAEIARIGPAELIVSDALWSDEEMRPVLDGAGVPVQPQDTSCFDVGAALERLCRALRVATLDAFGEFERVELAAMSGAVGYLEATQKGDRPALRPPVRERMDEHMRIDAASRASLEIEQGPDGGKTGSLLGAVDRTVTSGGARLLLSRLRAPLLDPIAIDRRLDAVAWLLHQDRVRDALRGHLRGVPDMERAISRLALGRGLPRDLVAIRDGLLAADVIAERMRGELPEELAQAVRGLANVPDAVRDRLDNTLSVEPPAKPSDGGLVREGALPELDEARRLRDHGRHLVMGLQAKYADETGARLRIKHNNVLGFFIEVSSNAADALPMENVAEGQTCFFHRQTLASAMRFGTEELADLEGRINGAADDIRLIEERAFAEMVAACVDAAAAIREVADALAVLDVNAAFARLAEGEGYCRPVVDDSLRFDIMAGRHPVVEQALRAQVSMPFVANDLDLSPPENSEGGAIWLLTGPNMGGKSTTLRQAALIAVMAQTGSFVPAGSAHLGVCDRLFSRVGASDDLARGRSTFMVEMVETAAILNQATRRSLVVLDEIGRGTSTHDGLSIAWAAIEHLHEVNGARALFATHFHELTALEDRLERLSCVSMQVEEHRGEVVFLHRIAPGAADRSYGIQVARLAGLPASVVARADAVLARLEGRDSEEGAADDPFGDLPLFSASAPPPAPTSDPLADKLREAIEALAPDEMTPREAMDALYALKAQAKR